MEPGRMMGYMVRSDISTKPYTPFRRSRCWIKRMGISPQISPSRDNRLVRSSRRSSRDFIGTKGVIRIRRTEGQLRLAGCEQSLVAPEVAQIAAEERENVRPVNMIDRAKRIQLENAGLVDSVLDVVEPSPRDEEILILPLVREPSAVRFHFTEGQAETLP